VVGPTARPDLGEEGPFDVREPAPDPLAELPPDVLRLWVLWHDVQALHRRVYDTLAWMGRRMKEERDGLSNRELCDFGFLCRELEGLLDDWRKDAKARKDLAGKLIAFNLLKADENVNMMEVEDTVRGVLATAKANMRMEAEIPRLGTAEFKRYCAFYGIPEEALAGECFPLGVHWPRAQEDINARLEEGKPLPPGLGKKYPLFSSTFVRRQRKTKASGSAQD
jgi:hypothetical protein